MEREWWEVVLGGQGQGRASGSCRCNGMHVWWRLVRCADGQEQCWVVCGVECQYESNWSVVTKLPVARLYGVLGNAVPFLAHCTTGTYYSVIFESHFYFFRQLSSGGKRL